MKSKQINQQDKSSDSEDEDPRLAHKKAQGQQAQSLSQNSKIEEQGPSKSFALNMFKERGLQITDDEINKITSTKGKQSQDKKKAGYVPAQGQATYKELELELKKALKSNDQKLASSILSTMIDQNIDANLKLKLGIMRCNILLELKQYEEAINLAQQLISVSQSSSQTINLRLIIALGKGAIDQVWDGYMDVQRAEAYSLQIRMMKEMEKENDIKAQGKQSEDDIDWVETDVDKLLKQLDDANYQFQCKTQNDKKITNFIYSTGYSTTGGLGTGSQDQKNSKDSGPQLIIELRNRIVHQIACGDHHTIAVVSGCSCVNVFNPNYQCQGINRCNGGMEVFGWGENTCGQIIGDSNCKSIIDRPILIKELSGKNIVGVSAWKATSLAFDQQGGIYEWGSKQNGKQEVEKLQYKVPEIKQLNRGQTFYVVLTIKNQVFIWGQIYTKTQSDAPILLFKEEQPKVITFQQGDSKINSLFAGDNHIICTNSLGKTFVMGDNEFGQLGLTESTKCSKEFVELKAIQHENIVSVSGFHNCSLFVTEGGALLCTGQLSQKKCYYFPKETEFSQEVKIIKAEGHFQEIYAIDDKGQAYIWETDISVKFKEHKKLKEETFRDLRVGQDENGPYGLKPFTPIRYHLYLSVEKSIKLEDLQEASKKYSQLQRKQYSEAKIYYNEILLENLCKYEVTENKHDPSIHNLSIMLENSGSYYLYVLMNETLIQNMPFELRVEESDKEETKRQAAQLAEEQRKKQELLARQKAEEKQRQLELDQLQKQQELQEQDRKKQETEERAKDAYKKFVQDQQEKKNKEEQERKNRIELKTGGGYDLDKLNKMKEQLQREQQQSEELNSPVEQQQPKQQKPNLPTQQKQKVQQQPQEEEKAISKQPVPTQNQVKGQSANTKPSTIQQKPVLKPISSTSGQPKQQVQQQQPSSQSNSNVAPKRNSLTGAKPSSNSGSRLTKK